MVKFGVSVPAPDPESREPFARCFEWCARAEELGFDYAVVPHHRFTPGYEASPWVALAALAARTSGLRLGTGIFVLPLDHPLDVAEEVATVDVVSGGRVFLGAGLGYRRYEWDALNLPFGRRVSRMDECLTIVQAALSDERVSFHGQHFDFDDVMVVPRPVQRPRPPVWLGANSEAGVRRASRLADGWMVGFGDRLDALGARIAEFRAASGAHGRRGDIALLRLVGIGADRAAVESGWLPATIEMLRGYRRAGAPGDRDEQAASRTRQSTPLRLSELGNDLFIAGNPDDVITGLTRAIEVSGCEYLQPTFGRTNFDEAMTMMDLFGKEVMPAFTS
jgi:probable F420-dependent oxidoreductase